MVEMIMIMIRYNRDSSLDIVVMCQALEACYQQSRTAYEERRHELEEVLSAMNDSSSDAEVKYVLMIVNDDDCCQR